MFTFLLAETAHAEAAASGDIAHDLAAKFHDLGVYLPGLVSQIVVFLLLGLALKKFAFGPVLAVLDERRKNIEQSLRNAERIKQELEEAEKTRAELIKKANEQATALIEEARASADKIGGQKIQEAIAQAENVLRKAEEASARDRERIMSEIKQQMGQLVVATTAKVVGRTLTPEDQARLQKEALGSLS
ncbi:MAG: F0F1 ATP synthase subunit B [Candidatus Methylacidiphilales bacterium]|nr:F0F1 ATP synthase subunit B [Candidatus Methylacidiphilales bacterium]